jgi:hypothetical protein
MGLASDAPVRRHDALYDLLRRNNATQFAYVPDAGHRILIARSLADLESALGGATLKLHDLRLSVAS